MKQSSKDEKYLELEDFWADSFTISWSSGNNRYDIINKRTGHKTFCRCLVRSFKACYIAKQRMLGQKLDDSKINTLNLAADLLGISMADLINGGTNEYTFSIKREDIQRTEKVV